MSVDVFPPQAAQLSGHVIIAGFGIVGRCAAESLAARKIPFCVIELNPATVERLAQGPVPIIEGDACDEAVLRLAGIERAATVALAMPDEGRALEALRTVRAIRADIKVVVRCTFSSAGLAAAKLGASAVVAEQAVAREFRALL